MTRQRDSANPRSTACIAGHPLHPMVIPFPIASFVGALVTDIAFARSGNAFWAEASQWLLGAGVVMGRGTAAWEIPNASNGPSVLDVQNQPDRRFGDHAV